ncbi:PAS domain S-box-containing protein/diguanylate cyclase (GGDEF) domain-containing protein [Pseudomonas oryzae]|uniref:cyclic-guanylate-specific phosphodiesterase n=2 Tax=Pseudomonas oryzae TaxID=1392877 RepID=A0A1H1PFW6_9PSED|nr:PAS domain S-box-containing protein/diguanylate cyclase (GGDEF) domain-containing protein [Pseudomonas oryzae]
MAVLLMLLAASLPPFALFEQRPQDHLSVHLLLETFSVLVALMVVAMALHTLDAADEGMARVLVFGFVVVAGMDMLHALVYDGMPSLLADGSTPKAIFFWLCGRAFEVLTMLLFAARVSLPGGRRCWLLSGVAAVLALFLVGTYAIDRLPATFVPGLGVTEFKARLEYLLCAANLALALWLFVGSRSEPRPRGLWFATSCFVMGIGELAFTSYQAPSEFLNVFGHLYKVAAYAFIYRATFLYGVREPYARLEESLRELGELKSVLDAHAIVAFTDARGIITRVNEKSCAVSQYTRSELIGNSFRLVNSGHHPRTFFRELWRTISRGEVWSGEICNRAKDGSLYWLQTTIVPCLGKDGVPEQYIAIRADITRRKQAEAAAQRLALHDVLTGLPNRSLVAERLTQALQRAARRGSHGAVLHIDLDHFKEVNDTLGHAQGDELLRQVAGRMLRALRQIDSVARLGGDEFLVMLEDIGPDRDSAMAHAGDSGEKIRLALAQPYQLLGQQLGITASVGVVLFNQSDEQPDELIRQAEMALYRAKGAGRDQLCFFDPSLQAEVTARAQLLRDLRLAQERGELLLFYQPVVDARRRILGVEALLRWQHPQRGLVSPALFIPLAEQSGLILSIGQWVLDSACRQLAAWADEPRRREWTVAVNVSARQFAQGDFVCRVEQALRHSGASADRLRLELTESMLHDNLETTIGKMELLRRLGVRFALDDFGTGYSSLNYLKRLPLDQLKIDKSFVEGVQSSSDAAIARTILTLADSLGVGVVAEGVETAAQMAFLLENGCAAFQGYLFSRPVPAEALPDSLALAPA